MERNFMRPLPLAPSFLAIALSLAIGACAATERRFPPRAPLAVDTDLRSVSVPCRQAPTPKDPHHVSCAPQEYVSPLMWDGADQMVFRPLSEALAVDRHGEAVNVNSLDEVPDSAWFTNRLGVHPMSLDQLRLGACNPSNLLDPESAADGSWLIDKGKNNGSSPGFRVNLGGRGKYMFKSDSGGQPERPSAASIIGAAAYHVVGFYTSCEQIVYFKPSLLKLMPGLSTQANFSPPKPFEQKALDSLLKDTPWRGELVRFQASAWLPGVLIGPFQYTGTRSDDPNDIIAHDDRRELRGGRLLAAWLDHFDAREQNTMDTWISDRKDVPDGSSGHVLHYYLDTSDCLGSEWAWDAISRRLGYSYVVDWRDMAADFVTLGIPTRPWDRMRRQPGREIFGYFNVKDFVADEWKNEYPNAAFSRMTERDGAWMARILARFTPEMVVTLAEMGQFTDPGNTSYLASVLEGRLQKILERYLTRLSPIGDVHVERSDQLCGVDLAEARRVREPSAFAYAAYAASPARGTPLPVSRREGGGVCVTVPHVAGDVGPPDGAPERYVGVAIADGVARGPLVAYLYDLGPSRGYRLAGLERPDRLPSGR
jgi:hypothetical protein